MKQMRINNEDTSTLIRRNWRDGDQVVIALNNFSPGVYVVSLKSDGRLIESKKIILVK